MVAADAALGRAEAGFKREKELREKESARANAAEANAKAASCKAANLEVEVAQMREKLAAMEGALTAEKKRAADA